LGVFSGSSGTYNLNGGLLVPTVITGGSGAATLDFGGGTLQASGSFSVTFPMTSTASGGNATVDTAGYAVTFAGQLSGRGGLTKVHNGTLTLAAANTYTGNTLISGGVLVAGAVNALSASSALTIGGGTLDASGFPDTVASLKITSSASLNLGLGNTLTSSGTVVLNGTLNVSGTGTLGNYRLLAYASETGSFASVTGIGSNYGLLYNSNGTELDVLHEAQVGKLTLTAANPIIITGGTTSLTVNVANSAPAGSDVLNFSASASGAGYGLSTTGSAIAQNSGNVTGSFNGSTLAAGGYTGFITVTGTNSALTGTALNSGSTRAMGVTVLGHSDPALSITGGNNQTVIVGATNVFASLSLTDSGTYYTSPLDVSTLSGLAGSSGTAVVPPGGSASYTALLSTASIGVAGTQSFSLNAGDEQALPGASALNTLTQTVRLNVLGHSNPALSISGGNNQTVIVGAAGISAALTLSNGTLSQCGLASLDVNTLSSGVSGPTGGALVTSGSSQSYAATLTTSTLGTQIQTFSMNVGDDHTLPGASAPTNVPAIASLTVFDHSNASLSSTATQTAQTIDFGNVLRGATIPSQSFTIYNLAANASAGYTANLKLTGFTMAPDGDSAMTTNLATFGGLGAGSGNTFSVSLNTANYTTTGSGTVGCKDVLRS
jgi:autotransporter-associated beta strand protein